MKVFVHRISHRVDAQTKKKLKVMKENFGSQNISSICRAAIDYYYKNYFLKALPHLRKVRDTNKWD